MALAAWPAHVDVSARTRRVSRVSVVCLCEASSACSAFLMCRVWEAVRSRVGTGRACFVSSRTLEDLLSKGCDPGEEVFSSLKCGRASFSTGARLTLEPLLLFHCSHAGPGRTHAHGVRAAEKTELESRAKRSSVRETALAAAAAAAAS